jgi:hypothetical protein
MAAAARTIAPDYDKVGEARKFMQVMEKAQQG